MKPIIIENNELNEKNYIFTHPSGLKIVVSPKKGFSKSCMMFGTSFGSVINQYKENGCIYKLPDGIAHFLEHKLFESEDGDAFTKYAATGGNANAYTSFTNTVYYFSCTDKLKENITILLDLLQTPYFTDENVNKEQGIIGQEINMYLDQPSWRVYFNMLQAMYNTCPVNIDIAGSIESISKITPKLLYECYENFYNTDRLCISICGDFDAEEIYNFIADKLTNVKPKKDIKVIESEEASTVKQNYITQNLDVNIPIYNIGFKDNNLPLDGKELIKKVLTGKITLDILFGRSSDFYTKSYADGLINDTFETEYCCEKKFAHSIISGESEMPENVKIAVLDVLSKSEDIITADMLSIQKILVKSDFIKSFNNIESITRANLEGLFNGYNNLSTLDILEEINLTDIINYAKTMNESTLVLSVINPKSEGK